MKEFILNNWQYIAGILVAIASLKIPVTQKLIFAALRAMATEKMITLFVLKMIESLVKSTKTKLDDAWFEEFKKQFDNGKLLNGEKK